MNIAVSRRNFLISAVTLGGVAAVGGPAGLQLGIRAATAEDASATALQVAAWLAMDALGHVTLRVNSCEIGQGAQTGLAQLVAEEMDLTVADITVEMAPVEKAYYIRYGGYYTGGSQSISTNFDAFRQLGATARAMLVAAAAERWKIPETDCDTHAAQVHNRRDGAVIAYGELAPALSSRAIPRDVKTKPRSAWSLIGRSAKRFDLPPKVQGTAVYGIDLQLPGLLNGALMACPVIGGRLVEVDDAPALRVAGVRHVVRLDNAVAVVAEKYWQARKGLSALSPRWNDGPGAATNSTGISAALSAAEGASDAYVVVPEGMSRAQLKARIDDRFANAARVVEASYEVPFLTHCPLEPMNATAEVSADGVTVWAPMQKQDAMKKDVATALGIHEDRVVLHTLLSGGGFGRRQKTDFGVYAALVARAAGAPVKLIWSREEDMAHGFFRPATRSHFKAAVAADGQLLAVSGIGATINDVATGGMTTLIYPGVAVWCAQKQIESTVPVGAWRSVDHSQNVFFLESLIDEVALALDRDPLAYRRFLLRDNPRALRLLDAAAERVAYGRPPEGRAHGVAIGERGGSIAAHIIEVARGADGLPQLHRVVVAFDCGTAVNPDAVTAQVEGGVIMGLSAALFEAIHIEGGKVVERNYDSYRLMRHSQCPAIEVLLFDSPELPVAGAGEPPLPPAAPALANAWAKLTGERVRVLPFKT